MARSRHLPRQVSTLANIDWDGLTKAGIKGIILDLDNTIVSEDDRYLSPHAEDWLQQANLSGFHLFILSNGKRRYRVDYWTERLGITAISPAKKPFPGAFRKAMAHMGVDSLQTVIIGDSFHTDVLGALLVGCSVIQVASLPHPPRWWERLLGRWVQIPYPTDRDLWSFNSDDYKVEH